MRSCVFQCRTGLRSSTWLPWTGQSFWFSALTHQEPAVLGREMSLGVDTSASWDQKPLEVQRGGRRLPKGISAEALTSAQHTGSTEPMVRADSAHSFFLGLGAQAFKCLRHGLPVRLAGQRASRTDTKGKSVGPEGPGVPTFEDRGLVVQMSPELWL